MFLHDGNIYRGDGADMGHRDFESRTVATTMTIIGNLL